MSSDEIPPPGAPPRPTAARTAATGPRPPSPGRPGAPPGRPSAKPPTGGKEWSPAAKGAAPAAAPPPEPAANLQMVPLTGEGGNDGAPQHSATSFFAMPTPKKKAKVEDDPDIIVAAPKAPAQPPPGLPPGMPPGMPLGGYPVPMGISGPVAAGPTAVGRHAAPDPAPELERAQSMRVFAIVGGLLVLVMGALAVCVILVVAAVLWAPGASPPADRVAGSPVPGPSVEPRDDEEPEPIPPPPTAAPRPPSGPRTPRPSPSPSAPATPAPPPPSATGTVTVNIPPGVTFTGVEVSCNDGSFRERGSFVGTTASVGNVPSGVDCYAIFKGGFPTKTRVRAGQTVSCSFPNNVAVCQ